MHSQHTVTHLYLLDHLNKFSGLVVCEAVCLLETVLEAVDNPWEATGEGFVFSFCSFCIALCGLSRVILNMLPQTSRVGKLPQIVVCLMNLFIWYNRYTSCETVCGLCIVCHNVLVFILVDAVYKGTKERLSAPDTITEQPWQHHSSLPYLACHKRPLL